jgi:hypothetical protein
MSSKWYEIQILKADGSVIGVDDRSFNDIVSGGHPDWDPSKDVVVRLIKFKYEDIGDDDEVIANYVYGEIRGDRYEQLKDIYYNHIIQPLA